MDAILHLPSNTLLYARINKKIFPTGKGPLLSFPNCTAKKVSDFAVPSRYVTNQTLPDGDYFIPVQGEFDY
jgi:hypothetical protein